jgi:hypothetical protein
MILCLLGFTKEEKEAEVSRAWVQNRYFGTRNSCRQLAVVQCCEWQHGMSATGWAQFRSESYSLEQRLQFI